MYVSLFSRQQSTTRTIQSPLRGNNPQSTNNPMPLRGNNPQPASAARLLLPSSSNSETQYLLAVGVVWVVVVDLIPPARSSDLTDASVVCSTRHSDARVQRYLTHAVQVMVLPPNFYPCASAAAGLQTYATAPNGVLPKVPRGRVFTCRRCRRGGCRHAPCALPAATSVAVSPITAHSTDVPARVGSYPWICVVPAGAAALGEQEGSESA